jgi:hypothetical protein
MYSLLWANQWRNPEQLGPARELFTRGTVHVVLISRIYGDVPVSVRDRVVS